jgi:hypothetical protein
MNPSVAERNEGKGVGTLPGGQVSRFIVGPRFIAPWGGDRHIPFILVKFIR